MFVVKNGHSISQINPKSRAIFKIKGLILSQGDFAKKEKVFNIKDYSVYNSTRKVVVFEIGSMTSIF